MAEKAEKTPNQGGELVALAVIASQIAMHRRQTERDTRPMRDLVRAVMPDAADALREAKDYLAGKRNKPQPEEPMRLKNYTPPITEAADDETTEGASPEEVPTGGVSASS